MNLLRMNRNLAVCYLLKDAFKKLWDYTRLGPAGEPGWTSVGRPRLATG